MLSVMTISRGKNKRKTETWNSAAYRKMAEDEQMVIGRRARALDTGFTISFFFSLPNVDVDN